VRRACFPLGFALLQRSGSRRDRSRAAVAHVSPPRVPSTFSGKEQLEVTRPGYGYLFTGRNRRPRTQNMPRTTMLWSARSCCWLGALLAMLLTLRADDAKLPVALAGFLTWSIEELSEILLAPWQLSEKVVRATPHLLTCRAGPLRCTCSSRFTRARCSLRNQPRIPTWTCRQSAVGCSRSLSIRFGLVVRQHSRLLQTLFVGGNPGRSCPLRRCVTRRRRVAILDIQGRLQRAPNDDRRERRTPRARFGPRATAGRFCTCAGEV
jgi:hypothetical protein